MKSNKNQNRHAKAQQMYEKGDQVLKNVNQINRQGREFSANNLMRMNFPWWGVVHQNDHCETEAESMQAGARRGREKYWERENADLEGSRCGVFPLASEQQKPRGRI